MDVSNRTLFLAIETELDDMARVAAELAANQQKIMDATRRYRLNGGKLSKPQLTAYRQSLARMHSEYTAAAYRLATLRVLSQELES